MQMQIMTTLLKELRDSLDFSTTLKTRSGNVSSFESVKKEVPEITNYSAFLETSKKHFMRTWKKGKVSEHTAADFEVLKELGYGLFGHVFLVRQRNDNTYHAMKVINRKIIEKKSQVQHTRNEREVMQGINFTFLIHLEDTFHDDRNIYFVMPHITGGDMYSILKKQGKFDEHTARFYASQVVLAFEYLHYIDIVYRDLKPENILIDQEGYLKLIDFGFCKYVTGRTWTLCGTPEYIAPEIILNIGYGKTVDWWSLGVFIYEMSTGITPFHSTDVLKMYENILAGKFKEPEYVTAELNHLTKQLLQVDLTKRYGNLKDGVNDIKNHRWFRQVDWMAILNRKISPSSVPRIKA